MYNAERPRQNDLAHQPPWDQRVARLLVRPLAGTVVTPNQITGISLLVGLIAAGLFAMGGPAVHWGAACFVLAAFLDHADGELARLTGRTSQFGHVFDYATGGLTYAALFLGMGFGLTNTYLGAWAPVMGLSAGLAVAAIFLQRFEVERRRDKDATRQPGFAGFEIEDIMYIVAPVTWLGGLMPFLVLASIGAPLFLLFEIWTFRRTGKQT